MTQYPVPKQWACVVRKIDFDSLEDRDPESSKIVGIGFGASIEEAADRADAIIAEGRSVFPSYTASWKALWRPKGQRYPIWEKDFFPVNALLVKE